MGSHGAVVLRRTVGRKEAGLDKGLREQLENRVRQSLSPSPFLFSFPLSLVFSSFPLLDFHLFSLPVLCLRSTLPQSHNSAIFIFYLF